MAQANPLLSRPLPSQSPESGREIRRTVLEALKESGQLGRLPTDLDQVAEACGVEMVSDSAQLRHKYIQSLSPRRQEKASGVFEKLKGIADLNGGFVWVPDDRSPKTRAFAKAHELSHHLLKWHGLPLHAAHLDGREDMQRDVRDIFEREANFAASELIFQCGLLKERSAERNPNITTLQCPVNLSGRFGASFHATIIRYVETASAPLALGVYYRDSEGPCGLGCFDFWRLFTSLDLTGDAWKPVFPGRIDPAHPWTQSSVSNQVITGKTHGLASGTDLGESCATPFRWEAWSNSYSIFVLLRPAHADTTAGTSTATSTSTATDAS